MENIQLLSIENLSKRYAPHWVLREVGFSVQSGEVLGLIGPNGAGKTTLLECVAGMLPADTGTVTGAGGALAPAQRKSVLFYLPDGIAPWAAQRVNWALEFFAQLYDSAERLPELVESLQLSALLKQRIGELSKGQRKRTLLALSLLTPQPLLLLDEPFDGLDLRQTRDVMALLRAQAAQGRTLLLSIHQLTDAARVCDRLVLLSAGRVVGEGSLVELREQAKLIEGGLEEVFLALT